MFLGYCYCFNSFFAWSHCSLYHIYYCEVFIMEIDYPDFGDIGTRCVLWTNANTIQIYNRRSGNYERRSYSLSEDGAYRLTGITSGSNLSNLNVSLCTEDKYIYRPEFPLFFTLISLGLFLGFITFLFSVLIKKCFNL